MTVITRATIRQQALRDAGGFVADATAATTTTITSSSMIGRGGAGDDNSLTAWGLYEPTDALADRFGIITTWDDSTGKATIPTIGERGGTETHEYYPKNDPHPIDWNSALDRVMQETYRITETVLPTVEGHRVLTLLNAPWIERRRDVVDVFCRDSPSIVDNGNFETWGVGSNAGLHGWTLSGTSATVTRVDGGYQRYAARVTSTGGNGAVLTQTIPIPIQQLYGESISVFARVTSSTAAMASIDVTDGTDTTQSSQHDGGSDWDELTATHTVNADAAGPLQIKITLDATNGSADFEAVVAMEGASVLDWVKRFGDQHARSYPIDHTVQMQTQPAIDLRHTYNRGQQIVVVSRQKFFKLTADSGAGGITDMPLEAAASGLIVKIAEQQIGRPNAARWAELHRVHNPIYQGWRKQLREMSRKRRHTQVQVAWA